MRFSRGAREIVLLGPTASVIPYPLFERGITAVMGVRIKDPRMMLRVISEAGGDTADTRKVRGEDRLFKERL